MIKSKLKIILATHDSNQSKLAKEIDVRQPTISAIANNNIKQIPIDVLDKICEHFKCQPGDIIEHIPNTQESNPAATLSELENQSKIDPELQESHEVLQHPTPQKQIPHYKPFTEADATRIDLPELLANVHYQIDIGETYGMDVLAALMEKARKQKENQQPTNNQHERKCIP